MLVYGSLTWLVVKAVTWANGLPTLTAWRSTLGPTSLSDRWSTSSSAWPVSLPPVAWPSIGAHLLLDHLGLIGFHAIS